jgi:hypothetical protein
MANAWNPASFFHCTPIRQGPKGWKAIGTTGCTARQAEKRYRSVKSVHPRDFLDMPAYDQKGGRAHLTPESSEIIEIPTCERTFILIYRAAKT